MMDFAPLSPSSAWTPATPGRRAPRPPGCATSRPRSQAAPRAILVRAPGPLRARLASFARRLPGSCSTSCAGSGRWSRRSPGAFLGDARRFFSPPRRSGTPAGCHSALLGAEPAPGSCLITAGQSCAVPCPGQGTMPPDRSHYVGIAAGPTPAEAVRQSPAMATVVSSDTNWSRVRPPEDDLDRGTCPCGWAPPRSGRAARSPVAETFHGAGPMVPVHADSTSASGRVVPTLTDNWCLLSPP